MPARRWDNAITSADFTGETTIAIHSVLERAVALGAEVVVVRAPSGEVLGAAERCGWDRRRGPSDGTVIVRSLGEVHLGVFTRAGLDIDRLGELAQEVERLVLDRWMAFAD